VIKDVVVKPLKQFHDERGKVMHMMKATDDIFEKFGEIYFSTCNPGQVKAWKMHKQKTSFYCVVSGTAKIVLHDRRSDSETRGMTQEIVAGQDNYVIVKIPPGVAHGFTSRDGAMVANLTTEPYSPDDNFDVNENEINYKW
jgi:dTDP-4-dehydrorhamnose 3,5-epimerase